MRISDWSSDVCSSDLGKTDLLAGLGLTEHRRSLLLRPQYTDLGALIERVVKIAGTRKGLNSAPPAQFKADDGRIIDFGAASQLEGAAAREGDTHHLLRFAQDAQCTIGRAARWDRRGK